MSNAVGPKGSTSATRSCMFYKLIVASILQDKKLKIPEKFVKKYGEELSSVATLTVPNGRIWGVELEKVDRKIWFHNGWHEFVNYYSIHAGYFLVFKYGGDSNFNVYIFDLTVSEIRYPCHVPGSLQEPCHDNQCLVAHKKQEADDGFTNIFGSGPSCHSPVSSVNKYLDKYVQSDWTVSGKYEHCKVELLADIGSSRDIGLQFNENELTTTSEKVVLPVLGEAKPATRRRKWRTNCNKHKRITTQKVDEKSPKIEIPSETLTRRWRTVTKEEKEKAIRVADTYTPDNPFFKVILRPSYVYRGFILYIPNSFARKYLTVTGFITLQVSEGKQWPVRCVCGPGRAHFGKGWTEFVWGNNLEEGDVCIFELIKKKDIVMKVTIFRVLEDLASTNFRVELHLNQAKHGLIVGAV